MHYRLHAVLGDRRANLRVVGDVRLDQRRSRIDRPVEPGDQVVDHDDLVSRVEQRQHRVAADIPCPAGHHDLTAQLWTIKL
jgi:hypothetical protein